MELNSLEKLYIHELKDLHNAEKQILKALPKMAKKASHVELRSAFEEHNRQTEGHVRRLEQILEDLEEKPSGKKCKGMEGIIEEGEEILNGDSADDVRDAGMIAAAQRVEHYEISAYGSARTYARMLGREKDAELLQQTLDEEGETDHKLTDIAVNIVNVDAKRAD